MILKTINKKKKEKDDGKMKKENFNIIVKNDYLLPIYDHAQSFYKKAIIRKYIDNRNIIIKYELISYNTIMVSWDNDSGIQFNKNYYNYSNTTLRHVKEFIKQFNHLFIMNDKIYQKEYITKKDILYYI